MRIDGIHHVTCITADARETSTSTHGVLGLRLVKKTVNQDDPTVYHLFYADEAGTPGSDITFFEYRASRSRGRGDGAYGWAGASARTRRSTTGSSGWLARPTRSCVRTGRHDDREGLRHQLTVSTVDDAL